jgi:hypothetical protein
MERIEQQMLRIAVRLLSAGALVGYGRQTVGGKLEPIPRAHWEAGDVDWPSHRLVVGDKRWHGVKVLDTTGLPPEIVTAVAADFAERGPDVSDADLRKFFTAYVDNRQVGDLGLAEMKMWEAAIDHFPHHTVTRERVRVWMRDEMDPAKKFDRGRPPS